MVNQPHNGTHLPDTRAGRGGEPQPVQPLVVSVKVCQRMLGDIDRKSVDKLIAEERLIAFRLSDRPRSKQLISVASILALANKNANP